MLKNYDPDLYSSIQKETKRQEEHIELIASENFVSENVLEAQGAILTINMPKGIQRNVTMVVVNLLMKLKCFIERKQLLMQHMLMCNLILVHKQIVVLCKH